MFSKKSMLLSKKKIDLEAISHQVDDKEIKAIELRFEDVIGEYMLNGESPLYRSMVEDISVMLSERFKFGISLTHCDDVFFSTYVTPTEKANVLSKSTFNLNGFVDSLRRSPNSAMTFEKTSKELDTILDNAYKALNDTLNTSSINIDLAKATITGLPRDFNICILIDLPLLIDEYDFEANELMGCILHEVGHTFSHLEQLYRSTIGVSNLIDTIRDEYVNGGRKMRTVLELTYSKNTGKPSSNLSAVKLVLETAKSVFTLGEENTGRKDSESLADVFSTRFGYGNEIVTALVKIGAFSGTRVSNVYTHSLSIMSIVCLLFGLMLIGAGLTSMVAMVVGFLFMFVGAMFSDKTEIYDNELTEDIRKKSNSYDSNYDRINKVRQQLISSLKNSDLSNQQIKNIINQVDNVDDELKMLKTFIIKDGADTKLDVKYLLEDLVNNDLNLSIARLKTI